MSEKPTRVELVIHTLRDKHRYAVDASFGPDDAWEFHLHEIHDDETDKRPRRYVSRCGLIQVDLIDQEGTAMSEKTECAGCGSYTSANFRAFDQGQPCPQCALPFEAHLVAITARRQHADEDLVARYLGAEWSAAAAKAELALLRHRLAGVGEALESAPEEG